MPAQKEENLDDFSSMSPFNEFSNSSTETLEKPKDLEPLESFIPIGNEPNNNICKEELEDEKIAAQFDAFNSFFYISREHEAVVHVRNLVRPFTIKDLRAEISEHGSIKEGRFWIDRMMSHAIFEMETLEQANSVCNALNDRPWPAYNPKTLSVYPTTKEDLDTSMAKEPYCEPIAGERGVVRGLGERKERVLEIERKCARDVEREKEREKRAKRRREEDTYDRKRRSRERSPFYRAKNEKEREERTKKRRFEDTYDRNRRGRESSPYRRSDREKEQEEGAKKRRDEDTYDRKRRARESSPYRRAEKERGRRGRY